MEKLFLHVCCSRCAVIPLLKLLDEGYDKNQLYLWFYNPNIHPKAEFLRRRDSVAFLAYTQKLNIDFNADYDAAQFLNLVSVSPEAPGRCRLCYRMRFEAAAKEAASKGYNFFTSTLSFSKRQQHNLIEEEGHKAAEKYGINFVYYDWRAFWKEGHELANKLSLYKQNYCGCIYSAV